MTMGEAHNAALELTAIESNAILLREKGELEHVIDLLESISDTDLDRLGKVLEEGAKDANL